MKLFAQHFIEVFEPNTGEIAEENKKENEILNYVETPLQIYTSLPKIKIKEVHKIMHNELKNNKSGIDQINGKILKELSQKAIRIITIIFNAILRLNYFPIQWKVAQIILFPKPGKPPEEAALYRPINLLPTLSQILEKLILIRIKSTIENKIIPEHQFGFREQHATTKQVHRITKKITMALEKKILYSGIPRLFTSIR